MPLTHIYFSDNSLSIFHCDIYDFPLNSIAVFIASKPFMFYDKFYVLYSHAFTNTHTHIYPIQLKCILTSDELKQLRQLVHLFMLG